MRWSAQNTPRHHAVGPKLGFDKSLEVTIRSINKIANLMRQSGVDDGKAKAAWDSEPEGPRVLVIYSTAFTGA